MSAPRAIAPRPAAPRLVAETPKDLLALSARWQDALLRPSDMVWRKPQRQFVLVGSRFCWERAGASRHSLWRSQPAWRVRSILHVRAVVRVQQKIMDRQEHQLLSLLALVWEAGRAPAGRVRIVFSGGAQLRLQVEALDVAMQDRGAPWRSAHRPQHPM